MGSSDSGSTKDFNPSRRRRHARSELSEGHQFDDKPRLRFREDCVSGWIGGEAQRTNFGGNFVDANVQREK